MVWGGDEKTRERLLEVLPLGSTLDELETEANARSWQLFFADDRIFKAGEEHHFGNGCRFQGGVSRNYIVAEYGPIFTTSVESLWMFDEVGKLGDVCGRSTTDAL
ncbi:hypothetical protein D6858_03390 [Tsuneonella suprasediminis]|uniref:Uncharacterized protein n=1 Tax=Tsuneonella suprasediminis TaxID=2306996 RepID=A0A419R4R5_9SPHN|nr:hypothetical protein D6858_03390 [Tsuneonella suprasediminis]